MSHSKKYLLLMLLLILPYTAADPNLNKASSWLSNNSRFDQDIETVSLSILALGLTDKAGDAQLGVTKLSDGQDASGCWPKGKCRAKDTALAALALSQFNKPTASAKSWLSSLRLPATSTGKFWIQIAAASDGQCRLTYSGKQKTFTLKNGGIVECGNKPWIEASCIDSNLLRSLDSKVDVDCSSLQSSAIISLIFQQGNSYYILDEQHSNVAKLSISNSCLAAAKGSTSCDYDATLFASLAAKSLGLNLGTQTYLESSIQSNNIAGYSILYFLTKKEIYRDILAEKQQSSGSFSNVYQTGLAMLALRGQPAGNNASSWLELQQTDDGSFNRNVRDTSAVIFGLSFQGPSNLESCAAQGNSCCSSCSIDGDAFKSLDNTCSQGQVCCSICEAVITSTCQELGGDECNFNQDCIGGDFQESKDSRYCCVGGACQDASTTTSTSLPLCNFDDVCDLGETIDSCPDDCEEKSNLLLWFIIIVVLLAVLGGAYFFLRRRGINIFARKEKPDARQQVQRPAYPVSRPMVRQQPRQPFQQRQPARKRPLRSKIEQELEKSLEEAKKLLNDNKK